MVLRHDDPLVDAAPGARRAGVSGRQQSHRRTHRAADFRLRQPSRDCRSSASRSGRRRRRSPSTGVGSLTSRRSVSIVFDLDGTLVDSRRDLADSANALLESCGRAPLPRSASAAWSATARPRSSRARSRRPASRRRPMRSTRFLAIYDARLLNHTRPTTAIADAARGARPRARRSRCSPTSRWRDPRILDGLDLARHFPSDASRRRRTVPAQARSRRATASRRAARCDADGDAAGRRLGDRLADGAARAATRSVSGPLRVRFREFPIAESTPTTG